MEQMAQGQGCVIHMLSASQRFSLIRMRATSQSAALRDQPSLLFRILDLEMLGRLLDNPGTYRAGGQSDHLSVLAFSSSIAGDARNNDEEADFQLMPKAYRKSRRIARIWFGDLQFRDHWGRNSVGRAERTIFHLHAHLAPIVQSIERFGFGEIGHRKDAYDAAMKRLRSRSGSWSMP
jgi:hypothetical protein